MDLSDLNTTKAGDDGAWMAVLHPDTGMPLFSDDEQTRPMRIRLLGCDAKALKAVVHRLANKRAETATSGGKQRLVPAEALEADRLEYLVEATVAWENLTEGGAEIPFSRDAARRLYADLPWIREQADRFCGDRGNFIPAAG